MVSTLLVQIAKDPGRGRFWRHPGCQSPNHGMECYGNLWHCERCGIRVCYQEGTSTLYELCDCCWGEVAKGRAYWPTIEAWEVWLAHQGLSNAEITLIVRSVGRKRQSPQ